jgi:hypothetical protein
MEIRNYSWLPGKRFRANLFFSKIWMCSTDSSSHRASFGELVPKSAAEHIAIVGGGFSGVMTAVNLARLSEITSSQLTGQLQIHAAGIERVEASGSQVVVHLDNGERHVGGLVINATDPATKLTASRSLLLQNLLRRGLLAPDDTDMGVRVEPDHTVISARAEQSRMLLLLARCCAERFGKPSPCRSCAPRRDGLRKHSSTGRRWPWMKRKS